MFAKEIYYQANNIDYIKRNWERNNLVNLFIPAGQIRSNSSFMQLAERFKEI